MGVLVGAGVLSVVDAAPEDELVFAEAASVLPASVLEAGATPVSYTHLTLPTKRIV